VSDPRDAAVEELAEELDANLPRMAFVKYGQFYNDDPSFDVEAYYRRVADVILTALAADPARARAVAAALLTEEELPAPPAPVGELDVAQLARAMLTTEKGGYKPEDWAQVSGMALGLFGDWAARAAAEYARLTAEPWEPITPEPES
jgi:hypothetical protein